MNLIASILVGYLAVHLILKARDKRVARKISEYKARQREWWTSKYPGSPVPTWMN